MTNSVNQNEVDRIVARLNETRTTEHYRNHDRPDSRFVKPRRRQDPSIGRAKARIRTAYYRNRLDERGAASTHEIGMAMVMALVTSDAENMTKTDWNLVGRALADLQSRGFDLAEVKSTLRRLRNRMVDPADHDYESTEPGNPNPLF